MKHRETRNVQPSRQIPRALSLLGVLTLVEGLVTFIVMLQEPSELQMQVFLGYSARRWVIIVVHLASLIGIGSTIWGGGRGAAYSRWIVRAYSNQRILTGLFYSTSILFAAILVIMIRYP
jgi:protein-S-isoprenylcysteine O-methyltransferase Ste14